MYEALIIIILVLPMTHETSNHQSYDMQIKQRVHLPMKLCDQERIWKTVTLTHSHLTNSSTVSLFLFNLSSQTVQHFYKEHNQTLQRDCQITSRKWRPIWLPSY